MAVEIIRRIYNNDFYCLTFHSSSCLTLNGSGIAQPLSRPMGDLYLSVYTTNMDATSGLMARDSGMHSSLCGGSMVTSVN